MVENTPQFGVIKHMSRIKIVANSAFEQSGILWDDRKASSQIKQPD
jgi:hypothetical protein